MRLIHVHRDLHAVAAGHVVYVHPPKGAAVVNFRKLAAVCAFYLNPGHGYRYYLGFNLYKADSSDHWQISLRHWRA